MDSFRFRNWKVYKEAKEVFGFSLAIYKKIPKELKYSIGDQLIRSSLSISLNIAEGCGKSSNKELGRFLDIALGSSYETIANFDVLLDNGFIEQEEFDKIFKQIESIAKQLGGLKKSCYLSVDN